MCGILSCVSINPKPIASLGYSTITPPGRGDVQIPTTRLRVPGGFEIVVEPEGEGGLYTTVPLHLATMLVDEASGGLPTRFGTVPEGVALPGDWRYRVVKLAILSDQGVGPADLVKISLPGLLQRALRPYVSVITEDEWGLTIGSQDPDERAVVAYVIAQLVSANPTQAVADELGINPNAAGQRVYRLRRAGRLPASTRGKKHAQTVPSDQTAPVGKLASSAGGG